MENLTAHCALRVERAHPLRVGQDAFLPTAGAHRWPDICTGTGTGTGSTIGKRLHPLTC